MRRGRWRSLARSGHAVAGAHEARRRQAVAAAADGGDGAAGLRPVRLQLQRLCERAVREVREAAEPLRAGRQRNVPHAQAALYRARRRSGLRRRPRRRCNRPRRRSRPPRAARATIRRSPLFCRASVSTNKARKRKPGTSTSISPAPISIMLSAIHSGFFPQRSRTGRCRTRRAIDAPPDFPILDRTLREVLADGVFAVARAGHPVRADFLSHRGRPARQGEAPCQRRRSRRRCRHARRAGGAQKFPGIRPDPEAFIEALEPLQPRVYSISSSHRCTPGRVSLTVDAVRYDIEERTRLGVCSTFLGGRVAPGDKIKVYVQKAQHFALPDDPERPIIMIGPGTGVAPFRAFLHERQATNAPGPIGCSSAISARIAISSTKTSFWRCMRPVI